MSKKRRYYKGKRISKGELEIANYLEKNNILFEREKTFNNCLSPKNKSLRFDFYLPDYNLLIEYQGQHHYKPINKYKRALIVHNKTKIHDNIKKQFVANNNIILLEIEYTDYKNINNILTNYLKSKGVV